MKVSSTKAAELGDELVTAARRVLAHLDAGPDQSPETEIAATRGSYIATLASALARYAWEGVWADDSFDISDALHQLGTVDELLGGRLMLFGGEMLFGNEDREPLRRLISAAHARWLIAEGEWLTIEQLAALAGVAEKTVRTATNPKSAHPIRIRKEGHRTFIEAADALAWLSRRPDFNPTRVDGLPPERPLTTPEALQDTCAAWLKNAQLDSGQLGNKANWSKSVVAALDALLSGEAGTAYDALSPRLLKQFADAVAMPNPDRFACEAWRVLAVAHADARAATELGLLT